MSTFVDEIFKDSLEEQLRRSFQKRLSALGNELKMKAYEQLSNELNDWVASTVIEIMRVVTFERSGTELRITVDVKKLSQEPKQ